jgi:hypothetical protein
MIVIHVDLLELQQSIAIVHCLESNAFSKLASTLGTDVEEASRGLRSHVKEPETKIIANTTSHELALAA